MATTYLVTGASRGLGFAYTVQLLEEGHHVVAAARTPDKAAQLQDLATKYPKTLKLVAMDVMDAATITAAVPAVEDFCGDRGLDCLINNAGISGSPVTATETDPEELKRILLTNTIGPFLVVQNLLPLIRKGTKKQIVQISSTLGSIGTLHPQLGNEGGEYTGPARHFLAYRASKAALNMQTVSLAVDLKADGITVISMCPGYVATDMGNANVSVAGRKPGLTPAESIAAQLQVISALTLAQSGTFFNHTGQVVPW